MPKRSRLADRLGPGGSEPDLTKKAGELPSSLRELADLGKPRAAAPSNAKPDAITAASGVTERRPSNPSVLDESLLVPPGPTMA